MYNREYILNLPYKGLIIPIISSIAGYLAVKISK